MPTYYYGRGLAGAKGVGQLPLRPSDQPGELAL